MRKGTVILISFLLGLILVGGYILYDNYKNTQASTTTYYPVTLSTEDKEKGAVESLEESEYKAGEKIVLRAMPTEDYSFSGWYIEDKLLSTQNPYTYEVKEEVTIVAKFELKEEPEVPATYTVTLTAGEGGSVTPLTQTTYESGAKITLAATANEGYTFSGFYENSSLISSENPHTYTVTKDVDITAMFEAEELQVLPYVLADDTGNVLGAYTGTEANVVVPTSYSKGFTNTTNLINDFFMFDDYYTPVTGEEYSFYSEEDIFLFTIIYSGYSPRELMEYYNNFEPDSYPTLKVTGLFECLIEGADYTITELNKTFQNNEYIESITIPEGILKLNFDVFLNCPNLTTINIPESLEVFSVFENCPLITELNLKNADMSGSSNPFTGMGDIYITVNESNEFHKTINGSLYSKDGTKLFRAYCADGNFTIAETCIRFGRNAFNGTSIKSLVIPATIIGYNSVFDVYFNDCTKLEYLEIQGNFNTCSATNFKNCTSLETIKRPSGTMTNLTTTKLQKYNCNAQIVDL